MGIWRCSSASRVSCIQEAGGGGYGAGTRMWGGCGVPSMATAQLARCFIPLHALGPQGSALACRAQHLVQIGARDAQLLRGQLLVADRKSTRLNSSHLVISYAVFCLKKKNKHIRHTHQFSRSRVLT